MKQKASYDQVFHQNWMGYFNSKKKVKIYKYFFIWLFRCTPKMYDIVDYSLHTLVYVAPKFTLYCQKNVPKTEKLKYTCWS